MKRAITIAILCAAGLSQAKLSTTVANFAQRSNLTLPGLRRGPSSANVVADRDLSETFFITFNNLVNYGCYCMFEEDTFRLAGGNDPVDEYDTFCKIYHEGAVCTVLDDPTCEPLNVAYITPFDQNSLTTVDIQAECDTANGAGTCAANVCTIEQVFLRSFFVTLSGGLVTRPDEFQHERGFDVYQNCPHVPTDGIPDRACCGVYDENRKPYKTLDGAMECCSDYSIRLAGTCV